VIYDPTAAAGSRFSARDIPASKIARLYHSTASLTPNGTVMLGTVEVICDFGYLSLVFVFQLDQTQMRM
jgi:hypothetical protein